MSAGVRRLVFGEKLLTCDEMRRAAPSSLAAADSCGEVRPTCWKGIQATQVNEQPMMMVDLLCCVELC